MSIKYLISKFLKKIQISAIKNSTFDKRSKVASASNILDTKVGKYSYIGNYCTVTYTNIGNFCSIADNVIIGGAAHPLDWVSTSPIFHQGKNILNKNFSEHNFSTIKSTVIGNDVWIGNGCLIKGGIKIGNGVVIGMGSIVTKNIGDYEIWAGNPAKFIRKRFDDKTIGLLQNSNWWNWNDNKLKKCAYFINDKEKFISFILSLENE